MMAWETSNNLGERKVTTLSGGGGSGGSVPTGSIIDFGGSVAPSGFVLADGSPLNTTTYADLFAVYGYTYGGSGASFNVPDLRGRILAGLDNMGGAAANIITGGTTLGGVGGDEEHLLLAAESGVAVHNHSASASNHTGHTHPFTYDRSTNTTTTGGGTRVTGIAPTTGALATSTNFGGAHGHTITVNNHAGANAASAHNNLQPYLLLNKIIKT